MTCPECGQQMWNYETGQMRCANDHVFAITALHPEQTRVVRVDLPSTYERLRDFAIGAFWGGIIVALAQILADYL